MNASSVIKLGGSLLHVPDLPIRLKNYLADFSRPRPVLLCGGGEIVEEVRKADRAYAIGEEPSHWIALRALTITALIVEKMLPRARHVESMAALDAAWQEGEVPILDAYRFVVDVDEKSRDPLPRRWRVTSDSLAARMALALGASEVVLLKSITPPEGMTLLEAAREGIVDPHFPITAQGLSRVVTVNLREDLPREVLLV